MLSPGSQAAAMDIAEVTMNATGFMGAATIKILKALTTGTTAPTTDLKDAVETLILALETPWLVYLEAAHTPLPVVNSATTTVLLAVTLPTMALLDVIPTKCKAANHPTASSSAKSSSPSQWNR
jgi:hypothetical protein